MQFSTSDIASGRTFRLAAGLSLAGLAAAVCHLAVADDAARSPVVSTAAAHAAPSEPTTHAELYRRLAARVRVDFNKVPVSEVLSGFTAATGVDIELVEKLGDRRFRKTCDVPIVLTAPQPVPLRIALQMTMRQTGYQYYLVLGESGVRLVEAGLMDDQYVLMTHDLAGVPDYTTHLRTRFIERLRRGVTPDDWQTADGPWIAPARSVFAIDVYHKPVVQHEIDRLWWREYHQRSGTAPIVSQSTQATLTLDANTASDTDFAARIQELRQAYPLVSLAGRLDYEHRQPAEQVVSVSADVDSRLVAREQAIHGISWQETDGLSIRAASLKQLHGDEVKKFITRPGFGKSRIQPPLVVVPSPDYLDLQPLVRQPLPSVEIDPPTAELPMALPTTASIAAAGSAKLPSLARLATLHESGLNSFLAPYYRHGYVKDREHVAGFRSHGFISLARLEQPESYRGSEPTEHWATRRLELISLLKHDPPRAYQSDALPLMDELKEVTTRPLNDFETQALPQLVASEDVVARATTNQIEMVGAIRAARQCTACHEVQRGQLLGAFTYTLVRDPLILPATGDSTAGDPTAGDRSAQQQRAAEILPK